MGDYISASEVKNFAKITYEDLGFASDTEYNTFNSLCEIPRVFLPLFN